MSGRVLGLIGAAFIALAIYIAAQTIYTLATANPPPPLDPRHRLDRGYDRRDARARHRQDPQL